MAIQSLNEGDQMLQTIRYNNNMKIRHRCTTGQTYRTVEWEQFEWVQKKKYKNILIPEI